MGINYNNTKLFIDRVSRSDAYLFDKTSQILAKKSRHFIDSSSKPSQNDVQQNTPPQDENPEPEGKSENTSVAPTVEVSVHAYVESSEKAAEDMNDALHKVLEMNQSDVLRGVIMAEILGKPKALRRSRWQFGNKCAGR